MNINLREILDWLNAHPPPLDTLIYVTGLGMGLYFFWHLYALWGLTQGAAAWDTLTYWATGPNFASRLLLVGLIFCALGHVSSIALNTVFKFGYGKQHQGALSWAILALALGVTIIIVIII